MSYSDKEKHMDYQSDDVESSGEKLNNQSDHSAVEDEKVDDILPVGQLKWRKDEEEEQDTRHSLEVARKFEDAKNDGAKADNEGLTEKNNESEKQDHPLKEHGTPPSSGVEHDSSPHENRQLSLEDTLTPIDFKEYSIDPIIEEKNSDEEFKQEVKKPAFVAEQPAETADEQPVLSKKESAVDLGEDERVKDEKKEQIRKWVKILWLPVSLVVALYVGFVIGHTVIGDQPAGDIFNIDMWVHIYQLMFGS